MILTSSTSLYLVSSVAWKQGGKRAYKMREAPGGMCPGNPLYAVLVRVLQEPTLCLFGNQASLDNLGRPQLYDKILVLARRKTLY